MYGGNLPDKELIIGSVESREDVTGSVYSYLQHGKEC